MVAHITWTVNQPPVHGRLKMYGRESFELSVGSGIEDLVSNPVRPIITVHFDNPTDQIADSPTASPSLS